MTPERDQQIMDTFLGATRLSSDRRQHYLDKACGEDKELRAEVESLLKHHVPETLISADEMAADRRSKTESKSRIKLRPERRGEHRASTIQGRRRFAVASLILSVSVAVLWFSVHTSIKRNLSDNVESQLETILNADVAAVQLWLAKEMQTAESSTTSWRSTKLSKN